jgi:hypothetical protein
MKNKKWIILAIIIVILIGIVVYATMGNKGIKNNSTEEKEQIQEVGKIIKPAKYITIEIQDKEGQGLVYTEPLRIDDQKVIEEIRSYFNDSELYDFKKDYEENGVWIDFEEAPITTFYFEDGTSVGVFGMTFLDGIGPVIGLFETETASDKVLYKLNNKDIELKQYIEGIYNQNV